MSKQVIGLVGLGKLGLPIAVSIASRGYKVVGYDVNHHFMKKRPYEHKELGPTLQDDFQEYFDKADLTFLPLREMLQEADIVFVAVQTPHGPQYEGTTRLPYSRADFDYTWLKEACAQVAKYRRLNQTISVISTVLPGTMRREILPHIPDAGYTPAFPAMGTVMNDFLNPEFVLLGADDNITASRLTSFYKEFYNEGDGCSIGSLPICRTSIESAELSKVAYNTYITMKLTAICTFQEIAHKIPGCNIDEVSDVLSKATRRVCSAAYMKGGVQDSGPCHPRDSIAMSWLAERLKLSCDIFDNLMHAREWQTDWLANLIIVHGAGMKKVILGKAYKPESAITTGSCALLLANILKEKHVAFEHYDPIVDEVPASVFKGPACFFIGAKHKEFTTYLFPKGSVVIDPFRYIPDQAGVRIVKIGVGR